MPTPFLKWAGGKSKLVPHVSSIAPERFQRYFEPFLGAGAIFFALSDAGRLSTSWLSDANDDLIECFREVRDDVDELIARLEELSRGYVSLGEPERADFYYRQRESVPSEAVDRAARLVFLNKTCYNGLFRVNSRGEFNVPHGRYTRPTIVDGQVLRAASLALKSAELESCDFASACEEAMAGDFVYLDPPYQPLSRTASFTSYTKADFGPGDQARLRVLFDELTRKGVAAVLSNSDHPFIRDLYGDYKALDVPMSRAINSVGSSRSPITELLISNFDRPQVQEAFRCRGLPAASRLGRLLGGRKHGTRRRVPAAGPSDARAGSGR